MSTLNMSGHNADEEIDSQLDKAIETACEHIQEVHNILKRETTRVCKEKQAFDAVAEKLKHVHFPKTVKLNVGGQCFLTSLETMKKDPGSMLHAMFSERFETKPAEDGSYFIDRDGTHFRHILNYLRTGQLVLPDSEVVRRELLIEAEFYQIQGIVDELRARPFEDSLILSEEQRQILIMWLSDTLQSGSSNYGLLYRASRDGWTSANFHSRCDCKGSTVTVAKCGNYIFGGYTEIPWEGEFGYREFVSVIGVFMINWGAGRFGGLSSGIVDRVKFLGLLFSGCTAFP